LKYILDTNVVSELMKGNAVLIARLRQIPRQDVSIPQPVIAEIAYGIARLPKSKRRRWLEARFDLVRAEISRTGWSDETSDRFGAIKGALERKGTRIEDFDAAIAAHADQETTLVTANTKHMARVPHLSLEDWS
jgi:predicted nucleic acid-binding protein